MRRIGSGFWIWSLLFVMLVGSMPVRPLGAVSFHCPRTFIFLAKPLAYLLSHRSPLPEAARSPLFVAGESAKVRVQLFLKLIKSSRPVTGPFSGIASVEIDALEKLVATADLALFDSRVAKEIYGKEANEIILLDAFIKLEELRLEIHKKRFLLEENVRVARPHVILGGRIGKGVMGALYLSLIGTVLYGLAAGAGSPVSDFIIGRGKQVAFAVSNWVYPPHHERQMSLGMEADAIEHYRKLMELYSQPEQISLGRVTYFENALTMIDLRMAELERSKQDALIDAYFGILGEWETRYRDVLSTEIGRKAKILLEQIYASHDPEGRRRATARLSNNPE